MLKRIMSGMLCALLLIDIIGIPVYAYENDVEVICEDEYSDIEDIIQEDDQDISDEICEEYVDGLYEVVIDDDADIEIDNVDDFISDETEEGYIDDLYENPEGSDFSGIKFDEDNIQINVGDSVVVTLMPIETGETIYQSEIVQSVSGSAAKVSRNGFEYTISGLCEGVSTLKVTYAGVYKATCVIEVVNPEPHWTLNGCPTLIIKAGETIDASVDNTEIFSSYGGFNPTEDYCVWLISSGNAYVNVDEMQIKGIAPGTSTLYLKVKKEGVVYTDTAQKIKVIVTASVKKYKIIYILNGGKNNSKNPLYYYENSDSIYLKSPTKKGYKFKGWYSDSSYKIKVSKIEKGHTGNVTVYSKWAANTYNIKFNSMGGTGKMPVMKNISYGKLKRLNACKFRKNKYVFCGWATSKEKARKGIVKYKNKEKIKNLTASNGKTIVLYAVWKKK